MDISVIISIVALVLAASVLAYCVKLALVYHRFNEQIADWARNIDESARFAIDNQAMRILRELDERISEANNKEENIEEENE